MMKKSGNRTVVIKIFASDLEIKGTGNQVVYGSKQWHDWITEGKSFIFKGRAGHFTARRELRRGIPYWYAYRRRSGKLLKTYVGKSEDLTLERMEMVSDSLAGQAALTRLPTSLPADLIAALKDIASTPQDSVPGRLSDRPFLTNTKFIPPALPEPLIARTRLTSQIDTPLTFVYAPSGFGKTTLLNEWQHQRREPVAWVSLSPEDNLPSMFCFTLMAALNTLDPSLGYPLIPRAHGDSAAYVHEIAAYLTAAFRKLSSLVGYFDLILDDYQHIHEQIHAALSTTLLDPHIKMRLLIASHTRPPLKVKDQSSAENLTELRTEDLRFTLDEGIEFLSNYDEQRSFAFGDMQTLVKRTEGWAAGLMMAALALKQHNIKSSLPDAMTGAHTYMREYFLENTLYQQPQAVQQFLLKTAILRQLTGSLCDAVTAQTDGAEMLSRLWQKNLFLTGLEEPGWYRYHDMFAEMLLSELQLHHPAEIRELHRRAADWYCTQNTPADAVHHLLVIEAWEDAASLIESVALHELNHFGEDSRLIRWLQQLPAAVVQQHKTLLFVYMRLARMSMPQTAVERLLTGIESSITSKAAHDRTEDEQVTLNELQRLRQQWATGDLSMSSLSISGTHEDTWEMFNRIIEYQRYWRLDLVKGTLLERDVYETAKIKGNLYVMMIAGGGCAKKLLLQGYLRRSEKLAYEVLRRAYALRGKLPEPASIPLAALSQVCYERYQMEDAHHLLVQAMEVDPNPANPNMPINIAIQRALIQSAQGAHDAAQATIQAASDLYSKRPARNMLAQDLILYEALLCVRRGDLVSGERFLDQAGTSETYPLSATVRAEILLEQRQPVEAENLLMRLLAQYPYNFYSEPNMDARVMLAVTLFEQNKINQSLRVITQAIRIAAPESHSRPFFDHCIRSIPLLMLVLDTEKLTLVSRSFVQYILKALEHRKDLERSEHLVNVVPLRIVASITAREQTILQLISAGMTNQAIAAALSIAESTVKTHLKNIYAKLGVQNRAQAAAYAHALTLVNVEL